MEDAGKSFLPEALEKELTIRKFEGKSTSCLYFTLTDKKPDLPACEFRYLTQGACAVGDLLVNFTVLTQTQGSEVVKTALEMIANASHLK